MKHLKNWILAALLGVNIAGNVSAQTSQQPITVNWGTFNIRYDNPDDQENNWKFRKDRVATFIQQEKLDIVGMQEVLHNQLEDLKTRLPEYAEVGIGREDGKQKGEYAPIFYRKDRFKLLDSNTFWLSQYPDSVGFIGWDGACTRIATWAKLEDKSTGKIFLAVNTHMDHVGVEARRKGALLIIERIQDIVGNRPAVLTGDFNVNDKSEAYQTLTTNDFVLKDAYKTADVKEGVSYTFHDFEKVPMNEREKIDFIFVTPQIKVTRSWIPKENPDGKGVLSDHNPQLATLQF
ncbi:endonuclease/exonuclease/phosphatase family protein [Phocaeicola barnesiae]|uniref:endonuclease/exonuclease/phosphatase family protein n=1 Tax=Phocaeicola barnesiae TaxID=376804 RepID=UPI001F2AF225|nr:endonuclease/exonuclease/phosphatase family protein [Phocaeicola barnesiae]MCF2597377.1 endonuclease/exonuclease/phosphatase family protein [Phocaeicola barnesiae]